MLVQFFIEDKNYNKVISEFGNITIEMDYSNLMNPQLIYKKGNNFVESFFVFEEKNAHCTIYLNHDAISETITLIKLAMQALGFISFGFELKLIHHSIAKNQ